MSEDKSQKILDGREATYGDRVTNMERVADVWAGILGTDVRADQVPLMMAGYKLVRASVTPEYEDSASDAEGYLKMFREVIGDDMIAAATAEEFQEKKSRIVQSRLDIESELVKQTAAYNRREDQADLEDKIHQIFDKENYWARSNRAIAEKAVEIAIREGWARGQERK